MHPDIPFSIPAFRDFIPEKLRPWIILVFVVIFQFSGGIYLAAVAEMAGGLALMQEDILMAGYASLVGLSLTFVIMFRLKFRFSSKIALTVCALVIMACNIICMHVTSIPSLVIVCFFCGIFRMWATFECNSTIQLWLTPTRDLSVFFCFIVILVQGSIQLSGWTTTWFSVFAGWEYMHLFVIGLLSLLSITVLATMRTHRAAPRLPLYGIDWLGGFLWGLSLLGILFICIYGDYYDWFQSGYIRATTIAVGIIIILNLIRASFIRHPFIALKTWSYSVVWFVAISYLLVDILMAPSHIFEHLFMESILHYDLLHTYSLNGAVFAGLAAGAFFTWQTFAKRKWEYRTMFLMGISIIIIYLLLCYFYIDWHIPKYALVVPLFIRGFGYAVMAICLLTILSKVPFSHFFQAIAIHSFFGACIGGVLGTAILNQIFKKTITKNIMLLSSNLDHVNSISGRFSAQEIFDTLQQQTLLISMKEVYGILIILGLSWLLFIIIKESDIRPKYAVHPTYQMIRRWIKLEIRKKEKGKSHTYTVDGEISR